MIRPGFIAQIAELIYVIPFQTKGVSTRSYTNLFYLVLLYVYDLLSLVHVQQYVCVYEYDVLRQCWIFCTSYTCTTYKCTSLLYSDELTIIAGVSNQMVFLQDIHYKLFYTLIFSALNM